MRRNFVLVCMVLALLVLCACGGGGGNAPNNTVTAANAGPVQNVRALSLVTLDGSHSTGANGHLITYQWSFASKPAGSNAVLSNATIVNPTLTPDMPGVYVLSLAVNDGTSNSTPSTVTITVANANSVPVANAGPAQNATVGHSVALDGTLSSDADNDLLTYKWSISSKPTGSISTLSSNSAVNPTITPDLPGNYVFNLIANDGYVDSTISSVTVTVSKANSIPVANAGITQNVVAGSIVTLDGSKSSDADGDLITYSWSFTSKPAGSNSALSNFAVVNPTFTPDVAGAYILNLVVNDGKVNSVSVPVTINATKLNSAPVANSGILQNVMQGTVVTLDGSKSSDADGDLITYKWSFASVPNGSSATLSNVTIVNPNFTTDVVGAYVLNLIVNDGKVDSAVSTVTINAAKPNSAPVANAGQTQNVLKGTTVNLNGSLSSDADNDPLTYSWAFTSKPVESTAVLSNPTSNNPSFVPDVVGAYVLNLIVNDGHVNSVVSTVTINASRTNVAPVANAGITQNVVTGAIVMFDGSASSDADGDPLTYKWGFTSKPAGSVAVLSSASAAKPTFTPDVAGAYVLNLIVNDGIVDSAAATVTITAAVANAAPVANTGTAQSVVTGSVVTLDGSASSDANGDLLTYSWSFASIPSGSSATLSSATVSKPTFTADVAGAYVLNLVVNDGKVNSASALVTVTASDPSLQLSEKSSSLFDPGFTDTSMPYSATSMSTMTVSGVSFVTLGTFKLTATGGNFTVNNLSATDSTSKVVPYFANLSNGQTITPGSPVTFSLISPLTRYNTVNLTYTFTIGETGKTFTYFVNLKTN